MRYLLTRLLWLPVILLAVASLTFFVLRLVPGDPMDQVATLVLDQGQLDAVRAQWALDQPLWRQYLLFIGNLAQGDLGLSMASGIEINRLLFERLPPTIELTLFAMIISTIIGVGAGIISAVTTNRTVDYSARTFAILGLSIPWFWIAIMLIYVFAVQLHWLPVGGRIGIGVDYEIITNFLLIDTLITGNLPAFLERAQAHPPARYRHRADVGRFRRPHDPLVDA